MRPVHRSLSIALPVLAAVGAGARPAFAQTPNIRVAGRVQAQFSTSDGDSSSDYNTAAVVGSGFEIRRLRIQADVRIGENVTMVLQPSFEMGTLRLRDAFLRVGLWRSPSAALSLTLGQEKKPANRYELTSSNTLPSIERGMRLRGFGAVQTAEAAQNNLLEYNGYIAHDLGASADLALFGGRLAARAGVYNGSGESSQDVNNAKSFGARVTGTVLADAEQRPLLRLGASVFSRDRGVFSDTARFRFHPDSAHRSTAWGVDLEWGDFRPGLHVIADLAWGEHLSPAFSKLAGLPTGNRNFGAVVPNAPDSAYSTFASLQAVVGWRFQFDDPSGTRLVTALEPALRVDVTDPDTDRDGDAALLVTPALSVHFTQTTILRAGLDWYRYRDAQGTTRTATGVRVSWQANF
jgi:hypothetical protein